MPASVPRPSIRQATLYVVIVVGTVLAFLAVRALGESLPPPAATDPAVTGAPKAGHGNILFHVLLALAAVISLGRVLAIGLRYLGQPAVIGEMLAGILLGPSALGRIAPGVSDQLFPGDAIPHLGTIAQVGAVLYMFVVGLELNMSELRRIGPSIMAVATAGIVGPFVAGAALALVLFPRYGTASAPFTSFALFVGIAMAITAFPILARIIQEQRLQTTFVGLTALGAAAVGDVVAWCLLALVVGVAKAEMADALGVMIGAVLFIGGMLVLVRPLLGWYLRKAGDRSPSPATIAMVLLGVLLAALTTEGIGIHAVFGAFLLGALIPHDSRLAREIARRLEDVVTVMLLPAFFAYTGLRTQIGLVSSPEEWAVVGLLVLTAFASKCGSTAVAARATGHDWRGALGVGTLMTTHGLMELIVLNIGLDLGVISPTLFAMMVLMALTTTMAASPILRGLAPLR